MQMNYITGDWQYFEWDCRATLDDLWGYVESKTMYKCYSMYKMTMNYNQWTQFQCQARFCNIVSKDDLWGYIGEPIKLDQFCVHRENKQVGPAFPFCVELLDLKTLIGIEYMDFLQAFDKFCHILKNNMNKYKLVKKIMR